MPRKAPEALLRHVEGVSPLLLPHYMLCEHLLYKVEGIEEREEEAAEATY